MNTPPLFDGERFESSKFRMKFFVDANNFEMWDFILNRLCTITCCVDNKVLNKHD